MITVSSTAWGAIVLLALQSWPLVASCQAPGPALQKEISKQESIYHGKGEQQLEGYVIDRSLLAYTFMLPVAFDTALANLGPGDRWLDIGAGEGRAVLDYYTSRYDAMHAEGRERRGAKANAVAISIEDRRTPRWHEAAASLDPGKIQYWYGRRLREYSKEELGRFKVITDVIGGFSYTTDLSRFMENALDILVAGGNFFTMLQDVHSEGGANKPHYEGSPYLTEIRDAAGAEIRVCSWLKSITCVEVTCEFKKGWTPPLEVYHIHKVCDEVKVPALETVHYEAGTPPERRFQLKVTTPEPSTATR